MRVREHQAVFGVDYDSRAPDVVAPDPRLNSHHTEFRRPCTAAAIGLLSAYVGGVARSDQEPDRERGQQTEQPEQVLAQLRSPSSSNS